MKKRNPVLLYALAGQIPLAFTALFLLLRLEAFKEVIALWGWLRVLLGAIAMEIVGLLLVYVIRSDAKKTVDEREVLIEMKAYRAAFQFLTIGLLGMIVAEAVVGLRSPMLIISIVICAMNGARAAAQVYFRRVH